jgi:predicted CopG family antitoxin
MNSTIQLSHETKELISSFGNRNESYEDIIKRMYKFALKEQLRDFLYGSNQTVSVQELRDMIKHANR